jgi:hypothetical protein
MPYIITSSIYPADKVPEVAKKYLQAMEKYPPDENLTTLLVPAAVKSTQEGIKTLVIQEAKEGKLEDAFKRTASMMVMFQSIPGYRYSVDVHYKVEEALALVGF